MDKLKSALTAWKKDLISWYPESCDQDRYLITAKRLIDGIEIMLKSCQEPELTKENIEKIKNGSQTILYASAPEKEPEIDEKKRRIYYQNIVYDLCNTAPKRLGVDEIESIIIDNIGGDSSCDYTGTAKAIHAAIYGGE